MKRTKDSRGSPDVSAGAAPHTKLFIENKKIGAAARGGNTDDNTAGGLDEMLDKIA